MSGTEKPVKAVLDACVLYPTVMREVLIGVASAGLFAPVWSDRLLEEWARAAARLDAGQEVVARGEIALLRSRWPSALVADDTELEETLYLPDIADRHVLASAISSAAPLIITVNLRDFPRSTLAEFGVQAIHPDAYLRGLYDQEPEKITQVVQSVRQEAERLSGGSLPLRALLKKARLLRLGKLFG